MERPVKGDVVVINFPSFNFKDAKKRPAIIAAVTTTGAVLCPITSKRLSNTNLINLKKTDFSSGGLKYDSFILPFWLSTFKFSHVLYKAGHLKDQKINEIIKGILSLFNKVN